MPQMLGIKVVGPFGTALTWLHYRKPNCCRVPSAKCRALGNDSTLGKYYVCRVLAYEHMVKLQFYRVLNSRHTANVGFAECCKSCTRQREHVPAVTGCHDNAVPTPLRS